MTTNKKNESIQTSSYNTKEGEHEEKSMLSANKKKSTKAGKDRGNSPRVPSTRIKNIRTHQSILAQVVRAR